MALPSTRLSSCHLLPAECAQRLLQLPRLGENQTCCHLLAAAQHQQVLALPHGLVVSVAGNSGDSSSGLHDPILVSRRLPQQVVPLRHLEPLLAIDAAAGSVQGAISTAAARQHADVRSEPAKELVRLGARMQSLASLRLPDEAISNKLPVLRQIVDDLQQIAPSWQLRRRQAQPGDRRTDGQRRFISLFDRRVRQSPSSKASGKENRQPQEAALHGCSSAPATAGSSFAGEAPPPLAKKRRIAGSAASAGAGDSGAPSEFATVVASGRPRKPVGFCSGVCKDVCTCAM